MGKLTPSLAAETNALREAYAAFNGNDIAAFVQILDPHIEWIEHLESPGGGTYRGVDAVTAHLAQSRQTWAEGSCEPQQIIVAGDRIIQFVDVRVRLKHETEWREGQVTEVYTFRDGKVIQVHIFADNRQALEWAGVKASDAN
jgi:ketosteroid isomerase-like protein